MINHGNVCVCGCAEFLANLFSKSVFDRFLVVSLLGMHIQCMFSIFPVSCVPTRECISNHGNVCVWAVQNFWPVCLRNWVSLFYVNVWLCPC